MRMLLVAGAALFISLLVGGAANAENIRACDISDVAKYGAGPPANCQSLWATVVEQAVGNGAYVHVPDPGCMNDVAAEMARVHQAALDAALPRLSKYAGPLTQLTGTAVADYFRRNGGGDIGRLFSPYAKNGALCAPVMAIVPVTATVKGFRFLATDAQNGGRFAGCSDQGGECGIGWSKFQGPPSVNKTVAMQTVSAVFMNWSNDRPRHVKMIVFYEMPGTEVPLNAM